MTPGEYEASEHGDGGVQTFDSLFHVVTGREGRVVHSQASPWSKEFVALMARLMATIYQSDHPVGTVEYRNDTYDFILSFPAAVADVAFDICP